MILQALTNYYETLLTQGKITPPGWATIRVSYGIELDTEGQVVQLYHLQQEISGGKKAGPCAPGFSDAREGEKVV